MKNIGYIQQSNYLFDERIFRNIAFGIPDDEVDEEKLDSALQAAQLKDLVNRLPLGLRTRSEEHTSELQSRGHLVCRLLLEKKNQLIDRVHRAVEVAIRGEDAAHEWCDTREVACAADDTGEVDAAPPHTAAAWPPTPTNGLN